MKVTKITISANNKYGPADASVLGHCAIEVEVDEAKLDTPEVAAELRLLYALAEAAVARPVSAREPGSDDDEFVDNVLPGDRGYQPPPQQQPVWQQPPVQQYAPPRQQQYGPPPQQYGAPPQQQYAPQSQQGNSTFGPPKTVSEFFGWMKRVRENGSRPNIKQEIKSLAAACQWNGLVKTWGPDQIQHAYHELTKGQQQGQPVQAWGQQLPIGYANANGNPPY